MNWLIWRLQRKLILVLGVLLIAFTALAIPTGIHFWHTYQHALANCSLYATPSDPQGTCDQLQNDLFNGDGPIFDAIFLMGLFVPLLLGFFLGAPLLSREYDEGTNKLVWTQSVSRRKWLTYRLGWALGFAFLYGLAVTIITTWWSRTGNTLYLSRFDSGMFDIQGLMPIAYSLFFTSVGIMVGAWFRKVLIAIGITLGVFIVFQAAFPIFIRQHYMQPVTVTSPMGPDEIDTKIPTAANWILTRNIVDKNGKTFDSFTPQNMPAQCWQLLQQARVSSNGGGAIKVGPAPGGPDAIDMCLNNAGYHQLAKYQPSYRYWDFQRIEAGIFLGMTALTVGATYLLVLKRDA